MRIVALVSCLGFASLCGCEGLSLEVGVPLPPHTGPAPGGETSPGEPCPPGPYSHLPQRQSYSPKSSVELKPGCYHGDFVLGAVQLRVKGAGVDQTVIHGNLVLQTQCVVSNLTVQGDVIFEGHQAQLENVEFFGRIVDRGSQNRY
jgi:hypothetical protein